MQKLKLHEYLQSVADGGDPFNHSVGLCINVEILFSKTDQVCFHKALRRVLKTWQHYSRNPVYAIAHPDYRPTEAYREGMLTFSMYEGEYGRRRRELAGLVAKELL